MEQEFNLEQTLIKFNQDPKFIELRERYSTRSFLEIMSVERSENRHSSFLAWLLGAKDFAVNAKDHPIVHLLDILIRRMGEQNNNLQLPDGIKPAILSRDIKEINIEEIKPEKAVKDVAIEAVKEYKDLIQDRLDIYIKGELVTSLSRNPFEIIIENKISSTEGGEKNKKNKPEALVSSEEWQQYCKSSQTNRYYIACNKCNRIFIFLTPGKDKKTSSASNPYFINITYQDVLDEIIEPLLANKNLSQRVRILLEEYVISLALPAAVVDENDKNTAKDSIIMAVSKTEIELIKDIFKNYPGLIIKSALSYRAAIGGIEDSESEDNDLLCKFCETNKALIIATLRVAIEQEENTEKKKEYQKAYKALTSNTRDYSQYSLDKENYYQKGQFAQEVLNRYIEQNYDDANLCTKAKNAFGFSTKNFWPILLKNNYDSDGKRNNGDGPIKIELKRYNESKKHNYLITTQWGASNKEGSFDLFLQSLVTSETFNKGDYRGKPGQPKDPKILKVQAEWKSLLEGKDIYEKYDKH